MDLFLLRHGKAEDFNAGGDFARALVEKGFEQASRAGRLLKSADRLPDIVLTSPLVRARQTAEEFCTAAGIPGPVIQGWLASGMRVETALNELVGFRDFNKVMIVGHNPDFSDLMNSLLGVSGGEAQMKKGAVACLRMTPPARHARLAFLIPPKLAEDFED